MLVDIMAKTLTKITHHKTKLEKISLEGATEEVIDGVTFIQDMQIQQQILSKEVELLISSEKLLKQQHYQFPDQWTSGDRIRSNFSDVETILLRRGNQMKGMIPALQQRVRAEDKQIAKRVVDLSETWEKQKPLSGDIKPTPAMEMLAQYDMKITKTKIASDFFHGRQKVFKFHVQEDHRHTTTNRALKLI